MWDHGRFIDLMRWDHARAIDVIRWGHDRCAMCVFLCVCVWRRSQITLSWSTWKVVNSPKVQPCSLLAIKRTKMCKIIRMLFNLKIVCSWPLQLCMQTGPRLSTEYDPHNPLNKRTGFVGSTAISPTVSTQQTSTNQCLNQRLRLCLSLSVKR